MDRVAVLLNSENAVLYGLLGGMPNPEEKFVGLPDKRDYIGVSDTLGPSCVDAAFDLLRTRIGPIHDAAYGELHRVEQIFEECREKRLSLEKAGSNLIWKLQIDTEATRLHCVQLTRVVVADNVLFQKFLEDSRAKEICVDEGSFSIIKKYEESEFSGNFLEFLESSIYQEAIEAKLQGHCKISEEALSSSGMSPIHMYIGYAKGSAYWERSSLPEEVAAREHLYSRPLKFRSATFRAFVVHTMALKYFLVSSVWRPTEKIECLIQELRIKGPMVMGGSVGKHCYKALPSISKRKIDGRLLHYFPKDSARKEHSYGHAVIVVGAEKLDEKELVYCIEPTEEQDPSKELPLYVYSYRNVVESIDLASPFGIRMGVVESGHMREIPECYGFHMKDFIPKV